MSNKYSYSKLSVVQVRISLLMLILMPRYRLISLKRSIPASPVQILYALSIRIHMRIIIQMFWKSIQGDTYPFMLYIDLPPATHWTWNSLCFLAVHGIEIKSIYSHKGTTTQSVSKVLKS